MACIKPIYKSGTKDSPHNYRPISLLTAFSKLLEKVVSRRITKYIEDNNLISPKQYGFRKGQSTEDAVSQLTSKIAASLDCQKANISIFLDLSKAFDTVSIPILLEKLDSQFGIRGVALEWFRSYLTNRMHCTKIGTFTSNLETVRFGVPQGSILGPTLFIMYVNDIHNNVDGDIVCYADDTAIMYEGTTWLDVFEKAETGMRKISTWLSRNLLTLNLSKTNYICFHKTAITAPTPTLQLKLHTCLQQNKCNCSVLTKIDTVKYLGILLDQNLNFKAHIKSVASRVRKIISIMKLLRQSASLKTLYSVYYAICQSIIVYCIGSWGSALKSHLVQLERAQRSVLKVMLKKPFLYPTFKLYQESNVLTVRQLFLSKMALKAHKKIASSEEYNTLVNRRSFNVPLPRIKSCFARRFSPYIELFIYNKIASACDIKLCSIKKAKIKISSWLTSLDYNNTENLLSHIQ